MKTLTRVVLTAVIAVTSFASFAQQPVPPPPVAPQPVPPPPPPAPPLRREPPVPVPIEPRSERRREVAPPRLPGERAPEGERRVRDGERRELPAEARDAYRSDAQSYAESVERARRRGPSLGLASGPERPLKPTPYLGVATATAPPVLAAQLGLKEGFGLVVNEVLPGSPAAAAGVQKHDVLKLLNDQQLLDPNQFATLVRSIGKDQEITVTLLRNGQEQKIIMKIGERMLPERRAEAGDLQYPMTVPTWKRWEGNGPDRIGPPTPTRAYPPDLQPFRQKMRDYQAEMQRFQQRLRDWQKDPKGELPTPPAVPAIDSSTGQPHFGPSDILREARPGGAAELRIVQPDGSTTFHTNQARVTMKDDDGEIEMTGENGRRVINIRDAAGKSIYHGPVDTDEQRKAVPEPFRRKIDKMMIKTSPGQSDARVEVEATATAGAAAGAAADSDVQ